jgi:hypothetical protein
LRLTCNDINRSTSSIAFDYPFAAHELVKCFNMAFLSGIQEPQLLSLDADIVSSDAQNASLQESGLLSEKVDDQEQAQAFSTLTYLDHPMLNLAQNERQTAAPPARFRKKKLPTLHENDWAPYRDRIIELHILENRPLKQVSEIMEKELGFCAEYVFKFRA